VFEQLRQSLLDAMSRARSPDERRAATSAMRDALVEAKMALSQVREAVAATAAQLARERGELETTQRRGRLAAQINDAETVRVAGQYEAKVSEKVAVLERKLAAQESELALTEREVAEMTTQLRAAAAGIDPTGATPNAGTAAGAEQEHLRHTIDQAAREGEAERQLAELKRRMGR
jgi:hypothetical protein